jgi:carbonic anhydrase
MHHYSRFAIKLFFYGFIFISVIVAQQWERSTFIDKWGEVEISPYYAQNVRSEGESRFFNGMDRWDLNIAYVGDDMIVMSITPRADTKSRTVPTNTFVDKRVNITLREINRNEQKFIGILSSQNNSGELLFITCHDSRMMKALKENTKFKILIDGGDWYVRAEIAGNLPTLSDRMNRLPIDINKIPFGSDTQTVKQTYGIKRLKKIKEGVFEALISGEKMNFTFSQNKLNEISIIYDIHNYIEDSDERYAVHTALKEKLAKLCDDRFVESEGAKYFGRYTWDYNGRLSISLSSIGRTWDDNFTLSVNITRKNANVLSGYKNLAWGASIQAVQQVYMNLEETSDKEDISIGIKILKTSDEKTDAFNGIENTHFYFFQGKLYKISYHGYAGASNEWGKELHNYDVAKQVERLKEQREEQRKREDEIKRVEEARRAEERLKIEDELRNFETELQKVEETQKTATSQVGGRTPAVGRSIASIQHVVKQNMRILLNEYNKRLYSKSGLSGKISVRFSINELGIVISSHVVESTVNDPELEQIIAKRVKEFVFDKIDKPGDVTEVTYPFVFSRTDE